jgi:transposase
VVGGMGESVARRSGWEGLSPCLPRSRRERHLYTLGLGLTAPWRVVDQRLPTDRRPHELRLAIAAAPGALFPCPKCGRAAKPHDWKEDTWRHLNFFQHACFITARVPRVDCPMHGVRRIKVPWARPESGFTLLFEQAAVLLMREMPVAAAARLIGVTDKRLWRVLAFYVGCAVARLDLEKLAAIGLDETATKRGHVHSRCSSTSTRPRRRCASSPPARASRPSPPSVPS